MSGTRLIIIGSIAGHIYALPNWFVDNTEEEQIKRVFRETFGLAETSYIDQLVVRAGEPLKFTIPIPAGENRVALSAPTAKQYLSAQLSALAATTLNAAVEVV